MSVEARSSGRRGQRITRLPPDLALVTRHGSLVTSESLQAFILLTARPARV